MRTVILGKGVQQPMRLFPTAPRAADRSAKIRTARSAILWVGVVLACAPAARAQTTAASAREAVARRLGALVERAGSKTHVGLLVEQAGTHDAWFANLPDEPRKPASLQKLLVTAAALEQLGPDFTYSTNVYLQGNELWVIGAGDPSLGDERLAKRANRPHDYLFEELAAALKQRGATQLSGLVLDDAVFETPNRHPDWPTAQADAWYQAPVGGLSYNDNCVDIEVTVANGGIALKVWPPLPERFVRQQLRRGKEQKPVIRRRPDSEVIEVSGTIARSDSLEPVSVQQPTIFFGEALKEGLRLRGVTVTGNVVSQRLQPKDAPLFVRQTKLADVVWRTNKFSQNHFADCLLKSLGAYTADGQRRDVPGTWESGRDALLATLPRLGVDTTGLVVRDGSGLSHNNRATPRQLVTVLQAMRTHRAAAVFRDSLAEPGEDGTLRRRFRKGPLAGHLRAKTGTISGVRGLAGYVTRSDGTELVFALQLEGAPSDTLVNQIAEALAE